MQRSSMTMAQSLTTLSSLETAAVQRPPRDGLHPDYPFENVVFQGGGAKVSFDEIYSMNCSTITALSHEQHNLTLLDAIFAWYVYVTYSSTREQFMWGQFKRLKN